MPVTCDQDIYSIGDAPKLTVEFRTEAPARVLTDPTTVTFTVKNLGTGVSVSYVTGDPEVTNPSVGVFVCQLPVFTVSGRFDVKVTGAGALAAVARGSFTVRAD